MRSVSFRWYISGIFLSIASILSAVLIYVSVQHSQAVSVSLSKDIVKNYSNELKVELDELSIPLITMLNTLANAGFSEAEFNEQSVEWLQLMDMLLAKNNHIASFYFGATNGNSYFIRAMTDSSERKRYFAPETTAIMLEINKNNGQQQYLFFDNKMKRIGSKRLHSDYYDPRARPWYKNATEDMNIHMTEPYAFYFSRKIGITFSRMLRNKQGVIAVDFTLDSLTLLINKLGYSDHSKVLLLTESKRIISSNQDLALINGEKLFTAKELEIDVFLPNFSDIKIEQTLFDTIFWQDQNWELVVTPLKISSKDVLYLVNFVAYEDLLYGSSLLRNELITISIITVMISFLIILAMTEKIAKPLVYLNKSVENIQRFSFKRKDYRKSHISDVNKLNEAMSLMENALVDFFQNLSDVARTSESDQLSASIVTQVKDILASDSCQLFVNSSTNRDSFMLSASSEVDENFNLQTLYDNNRSIFTQHVHELTRSESKILFKGTRCKAGFIIPLMNRFDVHIGALLVGFEKEIKTYSRNRIHFVREFLGFNEIVLEQLEQEHEQQALFHSFVEMTATSVDIKSPYTGVHCQRVPQITKMIAEAAEQDTTAFKDFSLTEQGWEELLIAAWLHDCGKVTTPDYVMDKATKLETVYDRINEVRMRYEVLKRDADITYWKAVAQGQDKDEAKRVCDTQKAELEDEFNFISKCNIGNEYLESDALKRLDSIANRTWSRTLPDNIGISQQEQSKKGKERQVLPVTEHVLADKQTHLINWQESKKIKANTKRDFKIEQPTYQYNRGELHNLRIASGTLTAEERYNVNDHIIQTYLMLDQLPYPEHLKNVPLIAGSHHEKMNGNGYPLKLKGEQIPLGGRMIAIADIFEALTAADRPYKKAKKLSESLLIMADMVKDEHLDADLFELFITKGIYQEYADAYLESTQIDKVDICAIKRILNS
ncbi:chemotaxis protein [Moritella sp. 24]|uniref:HD domain-containing phosphohydrolase n=1 Tax=Moritella sp. 24 TaxID=2746230 RepID=UPI001BA889E5|nr:HD domain-containing phosphohydrolase [Moritella sp. 24]QUM76706.1 chemotaxis protein [Moritella sp. 24]